MKEGLIEITEQLKDEYNEKLSKIVGFGSKITDLNCSFCGKSADNSKRLIAGNRCYICDECVSICFEIINDESV